MPPRGASGGSKWARQPDHVGDPLGARRIPGDEVGQAAGRSVDKERARHGESRNGSEQGAAPTRSFAANPRAGDHTTSLALVDLLGRTLEFDAGRTARVKAALVDASDRPILLRVEVAPFGGTAYLPVAVLEVSDGAIRAGGAHLLMHATEIAFYENQGLEWVTSPDAPPAEDVSTVGRRGNVRF